jgi:hypothetical protein
LQRVRNDEEYVYSGPARGISLYPHEDCEPLHLEFDGDLFVQDFTKTQFAPPDIHIKVVRLLKTIAPQFACLSVDDEGEFWDSENVDQLIQNLQACFRAIEKELSADPNLRGPVHLPSGRIVDLVS